MPQFVLAFPLNVASDESFKVTDFVSIDKDIANVIIPGCGVQFNVVRQAAAAGLSGLFAENDTVTHVQQHQQHAPCAERRDQLGIYGPPDVFPTFWRSL